MTKFVQFAIEVFLGQITIYVLVVERLIVDG